MKIKSTSIDGIKILHPCVFTDSRGFFMEIYQKQRYQEMLGIDADFVQYNHSQSKKHVLRGLHFQTKKPQGKLVRVLRGSIYDVVVDIRKNSPTFGKWEGFMLCEENKAQLWIPPGLAHGFFTLSDIADIEYMCTDYYDPENQDCLIWNDSSLNISWPVKNPSLSEKDRQGKFFNQL